MTLKTKTSNSNSRELTPMMQQWHACKEKCPDSMLLFRMGDFYESFYSDANQLSKLLDLTLTARAGIAMAGVPVSSLNSAIQKLTNQGLKVAIAEQMEDPKLAKGLVKRDIARIITPGTAHAESGDLQAANTYLASLHFAGNSFALAFADISTGDFWVIDCEKNQQVLDELARALPKEIICSEKFATKHPNLTEMIRRDEYLLHPVVDWKFEAMHCFEALRQHFGLNSLDGLGLRGATGAICSSAALLQYLRDDLCQPIAQLRQLNYLFVANYLLIDQSAQRHLELLPSHAFSNISASLFNALDETTTAMGTRLLQKWLMRPLKDPGEINARQLAVASLVNDPPKLAQVRTVLGGMRDLERLAIKVQLFSCSPRDFIALKLALLAIIPLSSALSDNCQTLNLLRQRLNPLEPCCERIKGDLVDEPAFKIGEGPIFRKGVCQELDTLLQLVSDGKTWIAHYQQKLREELNIKTLRIGFTPAFGYFIEVSKGQSRHMPTTFQRKQTLVNNERYISEDLKKYEEQISRADEKIWHIEKRLLDNLRADLKVFVDQICDNAAVIAQIDCLSNFAHLALKRGYTQPLVEDSQCLEICGGRHPVVELHLNSDAFIPNDTHLDFDRRMALLTGPNMGGKSTYIRQVALMVIMAQMGSFVPAASMRIGVVDKIFTRIGASDELSRGQSTFMVEMVETANILHNTTANSLVILDEIGRGTSTLDGIAIARSIAEFLLTEIGKTPRALFATHYLELTDLAEHFRQVVNLKVAVAEDRDQIRFLHKIEKGFAKKSFGIHVAQLAGNPPRLIARAREILAQLISDNKRGGRKSAKLNKVPKTPSLTQLQMFQKSTGSEFYQHLLNLKIDTLTPIDALNMLKEWQDGAKAIDQDL